MKIPHDRFFVLTTYGLLLQNLYLVEKTHINCSIYVTSHKVLDNLKKDEIKKVRDFFDKNGLKIIVHGPFIDLNPGSLDRKIREASLERLKETLEITKLFGSKHMTVHSGFRPNPYRKYEKEWLELSIEMWKAFVSICEKDGVRVNIENGLEETPELLIKLVKEINSPNFNICFDGGHFNAFSDISPLKAFSMLPRNKIGEIHLSDNDGTDDQHLPLGKGNIDLDTLFKKIENLKIEPIFTLEPRDVRDAEEGLAYLRGKGLIE